MKILCTLAGVGIGVTAYIYHDGSAIQMEKPELKSEIQRERLSDDTMKQIFEERKFRLEKFCEKNHPNRKMKSWDERPSHIYVADVDLGLVGCAPLKAGSSTWKAWWWYHLTPDLDHENHSVPGHQPRIAKIPIADGEKHQVESLISDETQEMVVDFTDFSDFYGTKPWPHINPHFDSIAAHCDICSFKYDYIIKAETMNDEANYILRQTGLDLKPEDGFMHRNSQLTDDSPIQSDVLKPVLENINLTTIQNLKERYQADYDAFGYDIDFESLKLYGW